AGRVSVNDQSLMRTPIAQEITWDPDLENVMEYAAWIELMYRGRSFHRIREPTFLYRRHRANISDQLDDRDRILRLELQDRYRQRVLARDGALPGATPRWRRAASRTKRALRRLVDPYGDQESLPVSPPAEPHPWIRSPMRLVTHEEPVAGQGEGADMSTDLGTGPDSAAAHARRLDGREYHPSSG
ncbi:MAG: hypothetical protein WCH74_12880, partial [Chloroflexota bacterium]